LASLFILPSSENQLAMAGSQLAGEGVTLMVNQLDRMAHFFPPSLKNFLAQVGISLASADLNQLTRLEKIVNQVNRALNLFSLSAAVFFAWQLTNLSMETGNLGYFLAIAPLNSSLLSLSEIAQRALKAYAFLKGAEKNVTFSVIKFLSSEHSKLEKILQTCPSLAFALLDFFTNKPAFFSWLSTFASFTTLGMINSVNRLPMNVNEAASGLIFEALGGGLGVWLGRIKDPYKAFLKLLPHFVQWRENNVL